MTDIRIFLDRLEADGNIIHIDEPLSPKFEIPAVMERFEGEKALIFEKVLGHDIRVAGGFCGSRRWILDAIGVKAEALNERLLHATRNPTPCEVGDGPVKEVVRKLNLSDIPVLTHFQGDPGPYITSGILHAKSPNGTLENVSFHRLQVLNDKQMAVRIVPRHLYRMLQLASEAGESSLDVSISIGLHPTILVAAALPAPFGTCEFEVANTLLGGSLLLTECEYVNSVAPANAELVLEGRILLDKDTLEGPFVDQTGTHDVERSQPIIDLVGAMHRKDFIYQGLLPSGTEHRLLMGMPRETRIWEYVRNVVPTVRGVNMTIGGCGWLHCVVSFEKFREGDPKNVLMATFAAHPSLKHAVVVDKDIDPFDMEQVEWAIATRFRGDEDLLVIPNVRVSSLDPVSDQELELGCKVGIDATRPISKPQKGFKKAEIPVSDRVRELLNRYKASS